MHEIKGGTFNEYGFYVSCSTHWDFGFIYKIVEVKTKNKKDKKDNSEERSR